MSDDRPTDPRHIRTVADFERWLKHGRFVWPGGYPLYFVTNDGEALSFKSAEEQAELVRNSISEKLDDGWRVVAVEINWEDTSLVCCHSVEVIECAYPGDAPGPVYVEGMRKQYPNDPQWQEKPDARP